MALLVKLILTACICYTLGFMAGRYWNRTA